MTKTMAWLIPLRGVLREAWNVKLLGRYESKEGDVHVDNIGKAITSRWFWACWQMCNVIDNIMVVLGLWSESCACHSNFCKLTSKAKKAQFYERMRLWKKLSRRNGIEDPSDPSVYMWSHCPMAGKHAAELACGLFSQVVEQGLLKVRLMYFFSAMAPLSLSVNVL